MRDWPRRWKRRALMSLNLNNCNKEAQWKKLYRNGNSFRVPDVVDLESSDNETQQKNFLKNNKNRLLEVDDEMVDMDYMMFLNSIIGLFSCSNQADGVVGGGDNDDRNDHDINDNEVDPDYKIFMEKLRKDGNSYVVEFDLSNGVVVLIKYEIEDVSCIGHGLEETVTAADSRKEENVATTRVLRSASKLLKMDGRIELDDVLSKGKTKRRRTFRSTSRGDRVRTERMSPVAEKKFQVEAREPISCPTTQCSGKTTSLDIHQTANKKCKYEMDCNIVDESYKEFLNCLNNLRKENMDSPGNLRNISRRDRARTQRMSLVAEKNVELEAEEPVSCLTIQHVTQRPGQDILQTVEQKCKYETNCYSLDECYQDFANCLKNDLSKGNIESPRSLKSIWRSNKITTERKSSVTKKNVKLEIDAPVINYSEIDECYQKSLNGENPLFTPEKTKNEKDKENLSDSDIIAVDNYPFSDGKDNPFVPSKSYHPLELNKRRHMGTQFYSFSNQSFVIQGEAY
ncbi:uncharacterized protein LOC110812741 [Carica papaya]|uniref:uncharacterized protein LOC110812741 n=1 Tax=Carica papaya TaxID=3649 RepID=UPI000B8CC026|nr:uncharacterized protein LOC110812741 [Carica papaya]